MLHVCKGIVVLVLVLFSAASYGLPSGGKSNAAVVETQIERAAAPDHESKQEVALLRAQLESTKAFQESVLSTVYWALGGTFVLAGLLLGFGWLANFKVYERDKTAMKAELEGGIVSRMSEINVDLSARIAELPAVIAEEVKGAASKYEKNSKASLEAVSGRVFKLEFRILKGAMEANPSDSMALTDALNLMKLCIDKAPDELPEIMHFMLKRIEKGGKLTAHEITWLNQILDSLPMHYSTLTEKLRAKLIASDIF